MKKKRYGNELHPLYTRWLSMNARCNNPNNCNYKNYGGRGISISREFKDFQVYATYLESLKDYDPDNKQVDRIDPNGNYTKGNLRWADCNTQIANQVNSGKGRNTYTGVNWSKPHARWKARVTFKGKTLLSSSHLTEKEAFDARVKFIKDNELPHIIQEWK